MFSQSKRRFYRRIGFTEAAIAQKERQAVATKAKADSPLVEAIYKFAVSDRPTRPNAITEALKAKLTKALPPPATPVPFINNLLYNGHSLN